MQSILPDLQKTPILLKLLHKIRTEKPLPNSFYNAIITLLLMLSWGFLFLCKMRCHYVVLFDVPLLILTSPPEKLETTGAELHLACESETFISFIRKK